MSVFKSLILIGLWTLTLTFLPVIQVQEKENERTSKYSFLERKTTERFPGAEALKGDRPRTPGFSLSV